jgi:hypothetical protein
MGWSSWTRKSQEASASREPLGVDLNAGRARAAQGRAGRNKLFPLDDPHPDLPLAISLDKRSPEVGRAALAICRKFPHVVCGEYLPHLGDPREWKSGRHAMNAEAAVSLALFHLARSCHGHDGLAFALPTYLNFPQVSKLSQLIEQSRVKLRGMATVPLALAAERATHYLYGQSGEIDELRAGRSITPTSIAIVDADDHALTATVVRFSETEVRTLTSATFPRLGIRHWRERLLDALSDRCVRQCRRDPRDTAEAEQMLFDQIEAAVERARTGQRLSLSVRSTHWFQDLTLAPTDLDAMCSNLCRMASDEIRRVVASLNEPEPPRAVWLTNDAGRLPGLAATLHQNMAERTNVRVLHPEAAAAAVANLIERWSAGELPRTHLDTAIPLPPRQAFRDPRHETRDTRQGAGR